MIQFLMIVLVVAVLIVTGLQSKQPTPGLRTAQVIILVLMAVLVAGQTVRGCRPGNTTSSLTVFERAAGFRLGQLLTASSPAEGTVLVLQWKGGAFWQKRLAEAQVKGLREGLGDSKLTLVVEGPTMPEAEEELEQMLFAGSPVTEQDLQAWIGAQEDLVAIVAFMDIQPLLQPELLSEMPPVYLKGMSIYPRLQALVERGFIKAVVVDKTNIKLTEEPPPKLDLNEVFELRFDLLTATETSWRVSPQRVRTLAPITFSLTSRPQGA